MQLAYKFTNDLGILSNYISVAYEHIKDKEKSVFWMHENYKKNPSYLFAKINLVSVYLEKKEIDKVEEIFEGKLELKLLYPDRDVFHVSEVVSFLGTIGHS